MNILSCLSLEVKEIGAENVAFWDAPAHRIYVAFWDKTHGPNRRNALHSTLSFRRRNCTSLAGRFGGVAHVTPMRGV